MLVAKSFKDKKYRATIYECAGKGMMDITKLEMN